MAGKSARQAPIIWNSIAKDGELVLHVTDHIGQEISTDGGEGKANIQQDKAGSKLTVKLEPSPHNTFKGSGEFQINTGNSDRGIRQIA